MRSRTLHQAISCLVVFATSAWTYSCSDDPKPQRGRRRQLRQPVARHLQHRHALLQPRRNQPDDGAVRRHRQLHGSLHRSRALQRRRAPRDARSSVCRHGAAQPRRGQASGRRRPCALDGVRFGLSASTSTPCRATSSPGRRGRGLVRDPGAAGRDAVRPQKDLHRPGGGGWQCTSTNSESLSKCKPGLGVLRQSALGRVRSMRETRAGRRALL